MPPDGNTTNAVRSLCDADVESCARALASAFADDPVYRYIHPGDREWERVGPRFFRILLRYFASHATVLTPTSGGAVAIWTPPEPPRRTALARLRFTLQISAALGRRISRGARVGTALESLHRDEPQWYLAILGTEPAVQRRGLASRLLEPVLAHCDAGNLPAHLETATETNLDFYASRGFRVIAEARVVGGPRIWRLRRAPRPARVASREAPPSIESSHQAQSSRFPVSTGFCAEASVLVGGLPALGRVGAQRDSGAVASRCADVTSR